MSGEACHSEKSEDIFVLFLWNRHVIPTYGECLININVCPYLSCINCINAFHMKFMIIKCMGW